MSEEGRDVDRASVELAPLVESWRGRAPGRARMYSSEVQRSCILHEFRTIVVVCVGRTRGRTDTLDREIDEACMGVADRGHGHRTDSSLALALASAQRAVSAIARELRFSGHECERHLSTAAAATSSLA